MRISKVNGVINQQFVQPETLDSDEVENERRKLEVLYHYTGEIKPESPVGCISEIEVLIEF